jgi:hypothetical protein
MEEWSVADVPMSVVKWLAAGERGISSEAIACYVWGLPKPRWGYGYPRDPDDLKRCLKLLAASPETKARFNKMRECGPKWAALVDCWDELERLFMAEAGDLDWSSRQPAGLTYKRMEQCFANSGGVEP